MEILIILILLILLSFILFWLGKIFYLLQRGFHELIEATNSLDERLRKIEENTQDS